MANNPYSKLTRGAAIAIDGGSMEIMVKRGCGLDVHQATVVACLLVVPKDGKVQKRLRTFGTTTRVTFSPRNKRSS